MRQEGVATRSIVTTKGKLGYRKTVVYKIAYDRGGRVYLDIAKRPYDFLFIHGVAYIINGYRDYVIAHRCSRLMVRMYSDYSGIMKASRTPLIIRREVLSHYENIYRKMINDESKIDSKSIMNNEASNKIIMLTSCLNVAPDEIFYLPSFIDNRGRQYYSSILSPTFNKHVRKLIEIYDENDYTESLIKSQYYKEILNHSRCVDKYGLDDLHKYYLINMFIELSKDEIKGSYDKYSFTIDEFIEKGIKIYDKGVKNILTENISKLLNKEKFNKKLMVYKDATASGLQNFGILAKYNKTKLKYLNLEGSS